MPLTSITAQDARKRVDEGALLIDIREPDEFAAENIPGARNLPLSRLAAPLVDLPGVVVFHCKSGARTRMNAIALANCAPGEAYILDGGIEAWKASGLPVKRG